ncbi:hypothetical protein IQ13_4133 [Lacibacter cauensis]|uniref:Probable membrane transporter protein n=1 Tax=Lacibacter cauensis TaxID=510947 RepID=A0A562SAW1_9BACT|nr:sulfite exporter TauE/SafE family protein [Lacibacter cauensis]TWI78447.1 hypothetical protein IQ13_4133 [Lacibacter cauensis]
MDLLAQYTPLNWFFILLAAFIIGLGKAGLKGVDMLSVTIMALVFGGKSSTGIVLPLLCTADIAAVYYYNRHAQWKHFWKLVPWMAIGILLGVYLGKDMDERLFRQLMAVIVVLTIVIVLWMELRKSTRVPENSLFAAGTGLAAGFTTMMGNLAGAFANLYFLAMRLPKNGFIGTAAWLFLVINFFKLPFQVFYWRNITAHSLLTDLALLPALALGFLLGIQLVKKLQDSSYRKVVIVLTLAGSVLMLLRK